MIVAIAVLNVVLVGLSIATLIALFHHVDRLEQRVGSIECRLDDHLSTIETAVDKVKELEKRKADTFLIVESNKPAKKQVRKSSTKGK